MGLVAALSLSFAQLASASPLQPAGDDKDFAGKTDLAPCKPKITITAQEGNHTYGAYQLFDGDLSGGKLINIKWGSGIDSTALLNALKTSSITELKDVTSAPQLAEKLAKLSSDKVIEFSKIATQHVTGESEPFEKSGEAPNFQYVVDFGHGAHGYYLVKDTDKNTAAALTSPILQVTTATCELTVAAKGSAPASTKEIKEDSTGAWGKTADFEMGEKAPFKLTGTMPSNLADFTTYKYGFTDFISKGFSLREGFDTTDVKVTVGGTALTPDSVTVSDISDETQGAEYKDGKKIEIMFNDLKAKAKEAGATLTADSVVTVEYSATVNEKAVVGGIGNPNKSLVVYEKDVNGGTEGKTPPQEVWAFTYQLDTTKVDSGDATKKLEGAKFVLLNAEKTQSAIIDNGKVESWTVGERGSTITTLTGGAFSIAGLDAGTYYLKEIEAPSGYNLPEDGAYFKFVISSTVSVDKGTNKGKIEKLTITSGTSTTPRDGDTTKGSVAMTIENTSGSTLPGTGGIGTVIFTVVGLLVMAGAAGGFVWRRKQNS